MVAAIGRRERARPASVVSSYGGPGDGATPGWRHPAGMAMMTVSYRQENRHRAGQLESSGSEPGGGEGATPAIHCSGYSTSVYSTAAMP